MNFLKNNFLTLNISLQITSNILLNLTLLSQSIIIRKKDEDDKEHEHHNSDFCIKLTDFPDFDGSQQSWIRGVA